MRGRERNVRVRGRRSGSVPFQRRRHGPLREPPGDSGTCSVTQNDDGTFTRPCHALADFDNTPPTARITNLDILISGRSYRFSATFKTRDNVEGNAVSYRFSVAAAGRALGHVTGTTPGGSVSAVVKVKVPKHAKRFTVTLKVTDPVHNSRTVTRSASVRH